MNKTFYLILFFVCIEAISQTYGQRYGNKDIAAILYLLSGIAIGVLALRKTKIEEPHSYSLPPLVYGVSFLLIGCGVWILGTALLEEVPIDYKLADMLPVIQIMGERWLVGEQVYAIIPELWNGTQPVYLPAMWLPYTSLIALEIDMRFLNLLFILLAAFLILDLPYYKQSKPWRFAFVFIPLLILLSYVFVNYSTLITITEEPLVIGFYVLLGYALVKNKPVLIIMGLACCALSRYALVFWAAAYLLYVFFQLSKKNALFIGLGAALLSLLLLVVTGGIDQLELFYSLKDAYLETLVNKDQEWQVMNTTQKNIGMARFLEHNQLPGLHKLLFLGSVVIPFGLYAWFHFFGQKWMSHKWFTLCCLKLSLVWFFNMNALPYSYLFYTSTFLSLLILGQFWNEKKAMFIQYSS